VEKGYGKGPVLSKDYNNNEEMERRKWLFI
jgi:hypothetical protein